MLVAWLVGMYGTIFHLAGGSRECFGMERRWKDRGQVRLFGIYQGSVNGYATVEFAKKDGRKFNG